MFSWLSVLIDEWLEMSDIFFFLPGAGLNIPAMPLDEIISFPALLLHIENLLDTVIIFLVNRFFWRLFHLDIVFHAVNSRWCLYKKIKQIVLLLIMTQIIITSILWLHWLVNSIFYITCFCFPLYWLFHAITSSVWLFWSFLHAH